MFDFIRIRLLGLVAVNTVVLWKPAQCAPENYLIIGDSMSKEYSIEFPILFPENPPAWTARNWAEILHVHRPNHFTMGQVGVWLDLRITGHEYNFAFPGSQAVEWAERVGGNSIENILLRLNLSGNLQNTADRVVIFLGGNDLTNNYGTFYDGADQTNYIADRIEDIEAILDYVLNINSGLEVVIVSFPDVGVTPRLRRDNPDPIKRERVTTMTRAINSGLIALAVDRDVGYADIFTLTELVQQDGDFFMGGFTFNKGSDPKSLGNGSEYLFSPDDFHPNTSTHTLFANIILDAFNRHYPDSPQVPLLSRVEVLGTILEFNPNQPFVDWATGSGIDPANMNADDDHDRLPALIEMALKSDPESNNTELLPSIALLDMDSGAEFRFQPGTEHCGYLKIDPEESPDLLQWTPVPESEIGMSGNHATVRRTEPGPWYWRWTVTVRENLAYGIKP